MQRVVMCAACFVNRDVKHRFAVSAFPPMTRGRCSLLVFAAGVKDSCTERALTSGERRIR